MKSLLDLAEDLSPVHEKPSALIVDVNGISLPGSDAERDDESASSDTDILEPDTPVDPEEAKRKAQTAAFTKHLEERQRQEQHDPVLTPASKDITCPVKGPDAESARIIDKVRDYQQEMFERAKAENVIAV